jgi:hypothetical protein
MRRRAQAVEVNVDRVVQETALAVDRELVVSTPVDTGRARSNWQVGANIAPTGTLEPSDLGAPIAQAERAVAVRQPGQNIYIVNNLPYIVPLNEGHSAQAPAGFVEDAVQAGREVVRKAKVVR